MFDVYLIADAEVLGADRLPEAVARALGRMPAAERGRVALQLRAKGPHERDLRRLAGVARELTRAVDVPLLVNGRPDVARAVGADGVHLPESAGSPADARAVAGPGTQVGVSCHDAHGLARALAGGADFATLSPVFASPGKGVPIGVAGFGANLAGVHGRLPVFALGGVGVETAAELVRAGARGVAVIRDVFSAPDPADRLALLVRAVGAARGESLTPLGATADA